MIDLYLGCNKVMDLRRDLWYVRYSRVILGMDLGYVRCNELNFAGVHWEEG